MTPCALQAEEARAQRVQVTEHTLVVDLTDGRTITVPLAWYPQLWYGSREEPTRLEILGDGSYIHWPDLDEDLRVVGLLAGRHSAESPESLRSRLAGREA